MDHIPDEIPEMYQEFRIEITHGARGQRYGAEAIRDRDRRHITVAAVYHSPLAAWIMLRHLIDITSGTQVDPRIQVLLSALCLAGQVVRQHNLLSTATPDERLSTLQRHLEWWNYAALPAIETILGPGSRRELLAEASKTAIRVPDWLDTPAWLDLAVGTRPQDDALSVTSGSTEPDCRIEGVK